MFPRQNEFMNETQEMEIDIAYCCSCSKRIDMAEDDFRTFPTEDIICIDCAGVYRDTVLMLEG